MTTVALFAPRKPYMVQVRKLLSWPSVGRKLTLARSRRRRYTSRKVGSCAAHMMKTSAVPTDESASITAGDAAMSGAGAMVVPGPCR